MSSCSGSLIINPPTSGPVNAKMAIARTRGETFTFGTLINFIYNYNFQIISVNFKVEIISVEQSNILNSSFKNSVIFELFSKFVLIKSDTVFYVNVS